MFAIRSRRKVSTKEALVSLFSKTTLRKSIYVLLIFISTAHWLLFELNSLGFSFFSRKKIEDQKTQSSFWKKNETYSGFENLFWFLLWQVATEKDFLEAVNKVIKAYAKFSATPRYMTYNWEQNCFTSSVYSLIVRFWRKISCYLVNQSKVKHVTWSVAFPSFSRLKFWLVHCIICLYSDCPEVFLRLDAQQP